MAYTTVLLVASVFGVALALVYFRPGTTRRWYDTITTISGIWWKAIITVGALVLLASGQPVYVLLGAGILTLVVLGLFFETSLGDMLGV